MVLARALTTLPKLQGQFLDYRTWMWFVNQASLGALDPAIILVLSYHLPLEHS